MKGTRIWFYEFLRQIIQKLWPLWDFLHWILNSKLNSEGVTWFFSLHEFARFYFNFKFRCTDIFFVYTTRARNEKNPTTNKQRKQKKTKSTTTVQNNGYKILSQLVLTGFLIAASPLTEVVTKVVSCSRYADSCIFFCHRFVLLCHSNPSPNPNFSPNPGHGLTATANTNTNPSPSPSPSPSTNLSPSPIPSHSPTANANANPGPTLVLSWS